MSGPVDVLAVMDGIIADETQDGFVFPHGRVVMAARDAVAELIAASGYVASYVANFTALTYSPVACKEATERLVAAIARMGAA